MRLTLGNVLISINHSTPLGTIFNVPVLTGMTYQLNLVDLTTPNTWSSDPALNTVDNQFISRAAMFSATSIFP